MSHEEVGKCFGAKASTIKNRIKDIPDRLKKLKKSARIIQEVLDDTHDKIDLLERFLDLPTRSKKMLF